jgi:hypothetical protein
VIFRRCWWLSLAVIAASSCSTPRPVHLEAAYQPVGKVCDRVHHVITCTDEGEIAVELPAAAEMVAVAISNSGRAGDCGDELMAWLRSSLAARPIDLRPRLQARIRALGTLVSADNNKWTEPAVELLGGLLIDEGKPIVHVYEEKEMISMGSQSITRWRAAVTLDELDRWVVEAFRRGFVRKVPMPNQYPQSLGDYYADLLARLFAARYAAPASEAGASGQHAFPFFVPARSRPPEPEKLGCGRTPVDLLWPDLVRVFGASPLHDRWDALPAGVINRLRHPETAPPCG